MADASGGGRQDRGRGFEEFDEVLTRLRDNGRELMDAASSRIAELRKRDVQEVGHQLTAQARELFDSAVNLLTMVPDIINRLGGRGEDADDEGDEGGADTPPPGDGAEGGGVTKATQEGRSAAKAGKSTKKAEKSTKKADESTKKAEKSTKKAERSTKKAEKSSKKG
ncbi:MAG: hypothetical protein M3203_08470 [Actinomycetota bacterium]|nr:hypothetical protein [Actinomycetota bacterium]